MFKIALAGLITKALLKFKNSSDGKNLGITTEVVDEISKYFENNNNLEKEIINEVEKARNHDLKLMEKTSKYIINIRGLIRPLCTIIAMAWYIFAKLNDVELTSEDYSIIGGILAFWFGFRSYEKNKGIF